MLPEPDPSAPTMRDRLKIHAENATCNTCHKLMDPIGFALEPFDATGRYRDVYATGDEINATGFMYDGTPINGPEDLRDFVLKYEEAYTRNVAEKLLTYAVGRGMEPEDMPVVRAVARDAKAEGLRFHAMIREVIESPVFQMNAAPSAQADAGDAAPSVVPGASSAG